MALTGGQAVYLDSNGVWQLSDSNSAAAAKAFGGIVICSAVAAGQRCPVLQTGPITIGATVTVGAPYYVGGTPGSIIPGADLVTGDRVILIGFATTAAIIQVNPQDTGVAVP